MTEKLSREKEVKVVERWLSGETGEEIHVSTGVSTGKISEIINEYKKKSKVNPEELRKVGNALSKLGTDPATVRRALKIADGVDSAGGMVGYLSFAELFTKYREKTPLAVEAGLRLQSLESRFHLTFEEVQKDFESKSAYLSQFDAKLKGLLLQEKTIRESLGELQKLRIVAVLLQRNNITSNDLAPILKFHEELARFGFTEEAARILASQMKLINRRPEEASREIVESLRDHRTITGAIEKLRAKEAELRAQISRHEDTIHLREKRVRELQTKIRSLTENFDAVKGEQRRELTLSREQSLGSLKLELDDLRRSRQEELEELKEKIAVEKASFAEAKQRREKLEQTITVGLAIYRLVHADVAIADAQLDFLIRYLTRALDNRR